MVGMDTLYSNLYWDFFLTKETKFSNEMEKHNNLILSNNITDKTIFNFKRLTIAIPNTEINYTNEYYFNDLNDSIKCKNNVNKCVKNVSNEHDSNQFEMKLNTIDIKIDNRKNLHHKTTNKKQKNISFSNEKLWEINRVNKILHNKISNGVKPTYSRKNPMTFVKATSTINRERKNKDIIKRNEILIKKLKNVKSTIHK